MVAVAAAIVLVVALTTWIVSRNRQHEPCLGDRFPSADCTGVPTGTALRTLPLDPDGPVFRVRKPGTVLEGVHIPGDLLITADDVTVRNSQIDGSVNGEYARRVYSFTISDSTVGPADGCLTAPAVGTGEYTALRLNIRGHGDGFRFSGNDVLIQDSLVTLCSNPGDHSDGVQDYTGGTNLVVRHNTIDQRGARDITAPIFIGQSRDVVVEDNLLAGGTYTIRVKNTLGGSMAVRDNKVVDQTWAYGPTDTLCDSVTFTGNELVTVDNGYRVTSTVGPITCP